jgi:diguanylate cyclase (GGDEF)-like protein/PAS domain S-box-containing protein
VPLPALLFFCLEVDMTRSDRPVWQALSIALAYLAFGVIWVNGTDWLLMSSFAGRDQELSRYIASIKGTVFVALSAALIFFLVRRMLVQLEKKEAVKRAAEDRFRLITENITEVFWMTDVGIKEMLYVSPGYEEIWKHSCQELYLKPQSFMDCIHPDDASRVVENIKAQVRGEPYENEYRIVLPDGSLRWIWDRGYPVRDQHGCALSYVGVAQDITRRVHAEDRYRSLFDNMLEGFSQCRMYYDGDEPIEYTHLTVNPAFIRLTGLKDVIGKPITECIPGLRESNPELFQIYGRVARSGIPERFETFVPDMDMWFSVSVYSTERDHFIVVFDNITDRKKAEEQVRFLAHHDPLTELPNRLVVRDRFEQAIIYSTRAKSKAALLFLDIDHFKSINDTLGHTVGDALLQQVAMRLRECVRTTDTVSRQGGDEFLIVLPAVQDTSDITTVVGKVLEHLAVPFTIEGHPELTATASLGVAVFPDDGNDFDTLLRKADTAMYHAKEAGRNRCSFFDRKMGCHPERCELLR